MHQDNPMIKRAVIDPTAPTRYRAQIVSELLRFVPEVPDGTDIRDANELATLLVKFDWPTIKRFGGWLFSDNGWIQTSRTGPSNDVLGRLRVRLREVKDDPDA